MSEIAPTTPPVKREIIRVTDESMFANMLDTGKFEHLYRVANMFAESTMIPDHYRKNPGNCFIALQMSVRLGVDPFMFMQKTYIVHGKPGMEAQLSLALINTSGLFEDALQYEVVSDDPDDAFDPSYMVRAWAVRKTTGTRVNGPWVDWKMVNAEKWNAKEGSKWLTMPSLMFMYRAATFFGRTACPERLMGMMTMDELEDIGPEHPRFVESSVVAGTGKAALNSVAAARAATVSQPAPVVTSTGGTTYTPTTTTTAPIAGPTSTPRKSGRPGPKPAEPAPQEPQIEEPVVEGPSPEDAWLAESAAWVTERDFAEIKRFCTEMAGPAMEQAKEASQTNLDDKAPESEWRLVAQNLRFAFLSAPTKPQQTSEDLAAITVKKFVDNTMAGGTKEIAKQFGKSPTILEQAKKDLGIVGSLNEVANKPRWAEVLKRFKELEIAARPQT